MQTGQWLSIEGVAFKCTIGVTERERAVPQDVVVNLLVSIDFGTVAGSDSIDDTVDYRKLAACVIAYGERSRFQLVETLASHLCRTVFGEFPALAAVRVEVEKLNALKTAQSVKAIMAVHREVTGEAPGSRA
jgi:dihydroneopterin aldolase